MRNPQKHSFKKEFLLLPVILFSSLIAGIYGILHDQITYSISPEYYFRFKFIMFGIPEALHNRVGAGIVGFMATWWLGLLLGTVYAVLNYFLFETTHFFRVTMQSIWITVLVTFVSGMIGLLYGLLYLSHQPLAYFSHWFIPENLVDHRRFIMVGSMHNWGYLGSVFGVAIAVIFLVRKRKGIRASRGIS